MPNYTSTTKPFDVTTSPQQTITAPIGPGTSQASSSIYWPTHIDVMGMGGWMTVTDINERDNISYERRKLGMAVYVVNDSTPADNGLWILNSDVVPVLPDTTTPTTSADWGRLPGVTPSPLTVEDSTGSPTIPNVVKIRFLGTTVTDEGGGVVKVAVAAGPGTDLYTSSFPGTTEVVYTVGGVDAGTLNFDLSDGVNTVSDILDMIFFPIVQPVATNPTISISMSGSGGKRVVDTTPALTILTTVSRGSVNMSQGAFAGYVLSGTYNGTPSGALTISDQGIPTISPQLIFPTIVLGIQSWTCSVILAASDASTLGPPDTNYPFVDNQGNPSSPDLKYNGGTITSSAVTVDGTYPIYLGQSDDSFIIDPTLPGSSDSYILISQTFSQAAGGANPRHKFEISQDLIAGRTVNMQVWNPITSTYDSTSQFSMTGTVLRSYVGGFSNKTYQTWENVSSSSQGGDIGGVPKYRIYLT